MMRDISGAESPIHMMFLLLIQLLELYNICEN